MPHSTLPLGPGAQSGLSSGPVDLVMVRAGEDNDPALTTLLAQLSSLPHACVLLSWPEGASSFTLPPGWSLLEAQAQQALVPGTCYGCPPGYEMQIEVEALTLVPASSTSAARLFRSVAARPGGRVVGILLAGSDWPQPEALHLLKQAPAYLIAQAPAPPSLDSLIDVALPVEQMGAVVAAWLAAPRTEPEVARRQQNLETLIDSTTDLMWSVDTAFRLVSGNRAYRAHIQGLTQRWPQEGDDTLLPVFSPERQVSWRGYYSRALAGEQFSIREYNQRRPHGRFVHAEVTFSPIWGAEGGQPTGVACYVRDVTAELANQQALQQAKDSLSSIMDFSLDVICTIDADGRFVNMSEAARQVWGYAPLQLQGQLHLDVIHPEDISQTQRAVEAIRRGEEMTHFENRYLHQDGHSVPMMWSARWDDERQLMYCVGRDATEKKQAEAKISLLLDHTEESFVLIDLDLRIVTFNQQFTRLYQQAFGREVVAGRSILDYAQVAQREVVRDIYARVFAGEQEQAEVTIPLAEGQPQIVEIKFKPARDAYGQLVGAFVSARDVTAQRQAQRQLEKSEKRFRALVENGADALVILDPQGRVTYTSPSVTGVLGYTEAETMGLALLDIAHPDEHAGIMATMEEVVARPGQPVRGHNIRVRHRDGSWRWMEATLTNFMHDPDIGGIVDNFRDVTDRVQAAQTLVQSEHQYKYLFENNPAPMFIWDVETQKILAANDQALHLYGYSRAELIGLDMRQIHAPEAEAQREGTYPHQGEQRHQGVYCHLKKSGEEIYVEVHGHRIMYHGRAASLVLVQDITYKIEARQKLSQERNLLRTLIDNIPDYIYVKDRASRFLINNRAKLQLLEAATEAETLGKTLRDYVDADRAEAYIEDDRQIMAHGEAVLEREEGITDQSGAWRWLLTSKIPLRDAQGQVTGIAGISRDITARKREEQRLKLMESVITHTRDAVLITEAEPIDAPGPRIIFANAAFTRMTGYAAQEVIGQSPRMLQGPQTSRAELDKLRQAIARWEPCQVTTVNYKKSGEAFWVNFSISPVADETGNFTHWISIQRDVTQEKRTEAQRALLNTIAQGFSLGEPLSETLREALGHLARYEAFCLAEIWLSRPGQGSLRLAAWATRDEATAAFYQDGVAAFSHGEGLPGAVWLARERLDWDDLGERRDFPRHEAARAVGLKTALGIPLIDRGTIAGVLLLGSQEPGLGLRDDDGFFDTLAGFFGSEILRKQLEAELTRIFAAAPDIICVAGLDGYFKKVNPAMSELLGYTEAELLTTPIVSFTHPSDRLKTQVEIQALAQGKAAARFENRYLTRDGRTVWLSWSTKLFWDEHLVYSVAKDITAQKELEALLDHATRMARIGGWELDLIQEKLYWSPVTQEIHQVAPDFQPALEEAIYFYREDVRASVLETLQRCIDTGAAFDFEMPIITAQGEERWVRVIGEAEYRQDRCTRLFGSFQDIHQRKVTELRLQNTANNIPGVIFQYVLYADGRDALLYVSEGSRAIWGLTPEAVMADSGQVWQQVLPADVAGLQESIQASARGYTPFRHQWRIQHPDGRLRWLEGHGTPRPFGQEGIYWDTVLFDVTERHELEELLRRSSEMARIGSWEVDLRDQRASLVYFSPVACQILEAVEDFRPPFEAIFDLCQLEDRPMMQRRMTQLIETGERYDMELRLTTRQGHIRWVRIMGQAERASGTCTKIYGSIQDVHDRKQAELALQKALAERNDILESIDDGFFAVDRAWTVTYWNRRAEQLLGMKRDLMVGRLLWEVYADAVGSDSFHQYHRVMDTGETAHFEAYYASLDRWIEVSAFASTQGLSVYFKDVTERKAAEVAIRRSNERYEKVALATNDAIWDWDLQAQQVERSGGGFTKLFGYEEAVANADNRFWEKHVHPDDLAMVQAAQQAALADPHEAYWEGEYRFRGQNGNYAYVYDRGYIIRDEAGKALRMVGSTQDVTPQRAYEDSLRTLNASLEQQAKALAISNAELEQFAYVASHDLQEPLRMVTSFLTELEKRYGDQLDAKAHRYIHFAVDGARRMRQIILDLLEFSRVGKHKDALGMVSLAEVVEEACHLQRRQIEETQAQIVYADLPEIWSYRTPLVQVFQNLLSNALKYQLPDAKPTVHIRAVPQAEGWEISVQDNGIGMEAEYFEKIFIIFQRLHNKEAYGGTGMGLAIVKKIVERLGGRIWVDSAPGQGSTFFFSLPNEVST